MIKNASIKGIGVNPTEYHQTNAKNPRGSKEFVVSSSSLRAFWSCPARWRRPIFNEDGSITFYERAGTEATRWGEIFDCFVLTPSQFYERYVVVPADAPKKPSSAQRGAKKPSEDTVAAISYWDRFNKENEGKIIITKSELFQVTQASKSFLEYPGMKSFIEGCHTQVHIVGEWHDPETAGTKNPIVIPVQCLVDLLPNLESEQAIVDPLFAKCAGDVKTTKNGHPMSWEKWAHGVGYDVQAAWNCDLILAAEPHREITSFEFLLCENYPPWQPARESMQNDMLDDNPDLYDVNSGRKQYRKMMADYCKCLKTGIWPDYGMTDEASNGVTICRPNPYAAQARQFAPQFVFGEDEAEEKEQDPDNIP